MKSFYLLRTNVGLTTNVKVVVDSSYGLYLESINSTPRLELTKLKKFRFNKNNYFDELIPYFFRNFPADEAFKIKNSIEDSYSMSDDFSSQYDNLYFAGARNIVDNKNYTEEYEYFAPLYVFRQSLPKYFIIFRVDGAGIKSLDRRSFIPEFLEKFKTVKLFDLTRNTVLGEWIDSNFKNNRNFPDSSLDIDFRNLEFSKWIGIDYTSGGYTSRSRFLENYISKERLIFDFEKYIFDGYSENKIIHPQIINFSFLYDDTPATGTSLRKWSINRYCGFYIDDLELVESISPFILDPVKNDVEILENNILYSPSGDPFLEGFKDSKDNWLEIDGVHYKVEKYEESQTNVLSSTNRSNIGPIIKQQSKEQSKVSTVSNEEYTTVKNIKYRIISDISLLGKENNINQNVCYINGSNQILRYYDQSFFDLENWNNAHIHLIEIDGDFHNLTKVDGVTTINTDYIFEFIEYSKLSYWINNKDPKYYKEIDLKISLNNPPKSFKIYRVNFTDIKDFDTQLIDNDYSKYEYESKNEIVDYTGEPKMFVTDFRSNSFPLNFEQFKIKGKQVTNIPSASDYTANLETFRISGTNLTELWSKNPIHSRFGYQNSISKSNVPYLLNNNSLHEAFNRCADMYDIRPRRMFRNLDYFYSLNSGDTNYAYHSLHIEKNSYYTFSVSTSSVGVDFIQDQTFRFELSKYLNTHTYSVNSSSATYSYDYFSYLFELPNHYLSGNFKSNVKRYSQFDQSDGTIPNITLFNGLKFHLYEVDSIKKSTDSITNINVKTSNTFGDYKFSVLLSKNLNYIDNNSQVQSVGNNGTFSHYQTESANLAYRTSQNATPSSIQVGDKVYVTFKPPYSNLSSWRDVTSVGQLSSGGYGFVTSATSSESFTQSYSGIWEVNFKWKKIKNWKTGLKYLQGDVIIWEDILYNVIQDAQISDPNLEPWQLTSYFQVYSDIHPFWKPVDYSENDWCWRQGDYWFRKPVDASSSVDFWTPDINYLDSQDVVLYKGRYFKNIASVGNQSKLPKEPSRSGDISENQTNNWIEVPRVENWYAVEQVSTKYTDTRWEKVSLWIEEKIYNIDDYVVYNKTLYKCIGQPEINEIPDNSSAWERIYSFVPDSNIEYSPTNNPILNFGDDYFICEFNRDWTLDNGITVYINKKWKNVLVNISINDNTLDFVQGYTRDVLYSEDYSRLTAANFIKQINNLDMKFGFIDFTSYVIIEEDGTFKKYNFDVDITKLPYILSVEYPDQIEVDSNSFGYIPSINNLESIRPLRTLNGGQIDNRKEIDYYSGIPISYQIGDFVSRKVKPLVNNIKTSIDNIKSSKNSKVSSKSEISPDKETLFRHSGYYMPIFYDIELFKSSSEFDTSGNYLFDTELTYFGTMKQRVISKRSRNGNILKLRPYDGEKSIYPMLDEFGFTLVDQFIFRSNWDSSYLVETNLLNTEASVTVPIKEFQPIFLAHSIDEKTKS